jgi:GNAT superfamily N-acetyltransferase
MLVELSRDAYPSARPLFSNPSFGVQPPWILSGIGRGVVRVDAPSNPRSGAIWDTLSSLYLAGDANNAAFNAACRGWLARTVIPAAREIGIPELDIHADSEAWYTRLPDLVAPHPVTPLPRVLFNFVGLRAAHPPIPSGYTILPITRPLLSRDELEGMDWLRGWILSFWPSEEAFSDLGIGFCMVVADASIARERVEFGTGTVEAHQRRGLSTATAAACVRACVERGLTPVWTCNADNPASIAVARKVGFESAGELVIRRVAL